MRCTCLRSTVPGWRGGDAEIRARHRKVNRHSPDCNRYKIKPYGEAEINSTGTRSVQDGVVHPWLGVRGLRQGGTPTVSAGITELNDHGWVRRNPCAHACKLAMSRRDQTGAFARVVQRQPAAPSAR